MSFANVPIGSKAPEIVNAIVEIPRGSNFKYEYDARYDLITLDRVLHSPLFYPVDYGFIPETCSPDGDPLDVLVDRHGAFVSRLPDGSAPARAAAHDRR